MCARDPGYEEWLNVQSWVNPVCLFTVIIMETPALRRWGGASRFSSLLIWRSVCEGHLFNFFSSVSVWSALHLWMIENSTSKRLSVLFYYQQLLHWESNIRLKWQKNIWLTEKLLSYCVFVRAAEESVTYVNFSLEDRGPKPLSIVYKVRESNTHLQLHRVVSGLLVIRLLCVCVFVSTGGESGS